MAALETKHTSPRCRRGSSASEMLALLPVGERGHHGLLPANNDDSRGLPAGAKFGGPCRTSPAARTARAAYLQKS